MEHAARNPHTPPQKLELSLEHQGHAWIAAVEGELDVATVPVLRQALESLPPESDVVIDLSRAAFVGVDALGWINRASLAARACGGNVAIGGHRRALDRVLEITSYEHLVVSDA